MARRTKLYPGIAAVAIIALLGALPAAAQFKTEIINAQSAEAPCVGIGPVGGPAAKKCVDAFLLAGFVRKNELGVSGLTIGTTGAEDGVVTAVAPNSPAAAGGITPGETITAVDGKPTHRTPADVATQLTFGKAGDALQLIITRNGTPQNLIVTRTAVSAPPQPAWPKGFMFSYKPLVNWRGQFVPCLGAGPAAAAAIEFCDKHFMPFGYVKVNEMGTAQLRFDASVTDRAVIAAVEANSPAARAGLKAGDEITAVEGKPLTASVGETAQEFLFGKAGDKHTLTVHGSQRVSTVTLTLAGN